MRKGFPGNRWRVPFFQKCLDWIHLIVQPFFLSCTWWNLKFKIACRSSAFLQGSKPTWSLVTKGSTMAGHHPSQQVWIHSSLTSTGTLHLGFYLSNLFLEHVHERIIHTLKNYRILFNQSQCEYVCLPVCLCACHKKWSCLIVYIYIYNARWCEFNAFAQSTFV